MGGLIAYLAGPFGTFAVIAGAALIAFGAWQFNNFTQRSKGAEQQIARTEKANAAVIGRANRVRTKSISPGVRGTVDPNYID
ncbi:protein of unknown function [Hyphomicrobium sp. 1Nfss2.1]|uniref:hypothetical protein n=1 Tax=Hyphomicrobium sp. 1Nfss2.1 TaxID=3413936 RepID=UPI003C7CA6A6